MAGLTGLWDQLVDAVCRPPRDLYAEADLVGGRRAAFRLYQKRYYRQDVELRNKRGERLQCSHYRPCVTTSVDGRLPCVVYLHCNSGSRRDVEEILYHLLPRGITCFAFDFAGSGLSDGAYVTLGAHEVDDLAAVVAYLREEGSTSTIGLWGRSMGAVTALLFSQMDPSVAGMVLDSPFSRLVDLMLELATDQQLRIPKPLVKIALSMLKRSVRKRAGFSVDQVAPLDCVGSSYIPALFGHASDDTFVNKHHSERLFAAYAGDKNYVSYDGDHNSVRPDFFYDSALIFLMQTLRVGELVGPELDLQATPVDALPHLHPRGGSIYVTASRDLADDLSERGGTPDAAAAAAAAIGGFGGSPAGSPRSPGALRSPGGGGSGGRQLSPPWSLPGHATALPQPLLGQRLGALGGGGGVADVAAAAGEWEAELGGLNLTEEEALQRALDASIQDTRRQASAGGGGLQAAASSEQLEPGGSEEAAAALAAATGVEALPPALRYNQAYSLSGGEGRGNPLYGRSSDGGGPGENGVPQPAHGPAAAAAAAAAGAGEEDAILAAAIAAWLQEQPAPSAAAAPAAGAAGEPAAPEEEEREVSDARAEGWGAAHAVADAHAAAEAAAVEPAAKGLQRALSDVAAADAGTGAGHGNSGQHSP